MKRLITVIGKGQAKVVNQKNPQYNLANYFLPENNSEVVTTPFIGYALPMLKKGEYDIIHILGTESSQWANLLFFLIEKSPDEIDTNSYQNLLDSLDNKTFFSNENLIKKYEDFLTKHLSVKSKIHLIPIGKDDNELWEIFEVMAHIPENNDIISLDITHGLRYQPFLITLALNYFKNIRKNVTLKDVYYGALELSDYFDKKTPIMKLNNLLKISDWIEAVNAFANYGDISALNDLLNSAPDLRNKINNFSYNLNLNGAKNIRKSAQELVTAINNFKIKDINLMPFKFVKESLLEVPKKILSKQDDWELFLYLAEKNWDNGQFALSILQANQAILSRVGDLIGVNAFESEDISKEVGTRARGTKKISNHAITINRYRIIIAHSDLKQRDSIEQIISNYPKLLKELPQKLRDLSKEDIPY